MSPAKAKAKPAPKPPEIDPLIRDYADGWIDRREPERPGIYRATIDEWLAS